LDNDKSRSDLTMILTGFVFGVMAVALYDNNIRNRIKRSYQNIKKEGEERLNEVREELGNEVQRGKKRIARNLQNGRSKIAARAM